MSDSSARSMASEFKDFILRGNVVDLAIGIVIGAAFGAVVTAFVKDIITPILTIPGKTSFQDLVWTVGGANFLIGDFLNTLISFVVIAAAVFFFVVKPMNTLIKLRKPALAAAPSTQACSFCLSMVPVGATRCAYCTSELSPSAKA